MISSSLSGIGKSFVKSAQLQSVCISDRMGNMAGKIIDFTPTRNMPPQVARIPPQRVLSSLRKPEDENPDWYEWYTEEYDAKEHTTGWFLGMGAIALLLIIFGIFARSYFFIAFVALVFCVIVMYTKRAPREILFVIGPEGVQAGKRAYRFSELVSFSLMENDGIRELSLETKKKWEPFVRFPLGTADTETIRRTLVKYIAEKEHDDSLSDQIARKIGL